jgi:hypothetical protein
VRETAARQCAGLAGYVAPGSHPAGLAAYLASSQAGAGFGADPEQRAHVLLHIDSSVGPFLSPNPFEAREAGILLDQVPAGQRRPLLVVTGQAQPSRRFLRLLARSDPDMARRCVVATGDAISFNVVYRDRQVTWPVQDLPFDLVFFCHQNPVDSEAGFQESRTGDGSGGLTREPPEQVQPAGTEDLLLYAQLVEALARAFAQDGKPAADADELATRLHALEIRDGNLRPGPGKVPLFGDNGERRSGTGEHAVYLRPRFKGERVLPLADIEVWAWQTDPRRGRSWHLCHEPLTATYDESQPGGGGPHAGQ